MNRYLKWVISYDPASVTAFFVILVVASSIYLKFEPDPEPTIDLGYRTTDAAGEPKKQFHAGEWMYYERRFEIVRSVEKKADTVIAGKSGIVYFRYPSYAIPARKLGKDAVKFTMLIPRELPPGEYQFIVSQTYRHNLFRTGKLVHEPIEFEVVK